jgi:two-component system, LuxR family, response regulator FixJ
MPPPAAPRRTIAIVEDDVAVLHSLQFALEAEGYAVQPFERAAEALARLNAGTVDCLVIDYGLPDLDGASLLKTWRAHGVTAPAIIIASNPTARCWREAAEAEAPVLEKPLLGDELTRRLQALFNGEAA